MQSIHILIVDDSPLVGQRLQQLLTSIPSAGAVHYLQTLEAASAQLSVVTPDILVLDHNFPGRFGDELLEAHADALRGTDVIIYSAYGSMLNHSRYRELGASLIFDKGGNPEDLVDIIEAVCALRLRKAQRSAARMAGHDAGVTEDQHAVA